MVEHDCWKKSVIEMSRKRERRRKKRRKEGRKGGRKEGLFVKEA